MKRFDLIVASGRLNLQKLRLSPLLDDLLVVSVSDPSPLMSPADTSSSCCLYLASLALHHRCHGYPTQRMTSLQ